MLQGVHLLENILIGNDKNAIKILFDAQIGTEIERANKKESFESNKKVEQPNIYRKCNKNHKNNSDGNYTAWRIFVCLPCDFNIYANCIKFLQNFLSLS